MLQEIERKTEEQIQKILQEAKMKAEAIIKKAQEEFEREFQHELHSRILLLTRQIIGRAEYEGRVELLKAKDEIVRKIYRKVSEKLQRIIDGKEPGIDYKEILYRLLKKAVSNIPDDEIIIITNSRDKGLLSKHLREIETRLQSELARNIKLLLDEKEINCMGGVIARNKDNTYIYLNTLDGRLKTAIEKLRTRLNKDLFKKFI